MKGLGNIKDMTGQAQSFFNKALGGGEEAESVIATAGGTVATNGNGGGLAETNEILKDILLAVTPDAEAGREAERERELERLEDQKNGGAFNEKQKPKGLFGDLFKNFKIGQLFSKGGIGKLIAALGTTLLSGVTTAFGSTGMVGKSILAKMGPGLAKIAGPALIIAGLAGAITDGIAGWKMADEWGVDKVSAGFGAAIGGTGKGWKNAFSKAGEFAMMGAGIGMMTPLGPLGALIGGIAGALIGGVFGWIGGERIAKALSAISDWFSEKWNTFLGIFGKDDPELTKKVEKEKIEEERKILETQLETAKKKKIGKKGDVYTSQDLKDKNIARIEAELGQLNVQSTNIESGGTREQSSEDIKTAQTDEIQDLEIRIKEAEASEVPVYGLGGMKVRLAELKADAGQKKKGVASGGYIVNRPTYLPSSGVVVGESKGYSGGGLAKALDGPPEMIIRGAAGGMLQSGGGATQVYPLGGPQADNFIQPVAQSIAGAAMNQMAMEKIGHERGRGSMYNQPPTIVDASTVQNVSNNTLIRPPSPGGQLMAGERGDFVSKIA
jgi:hypothetical protein